MMDNDTDENATWRPNQTCSVERVDPLSAEFMLPMTILVCFNLTVILGNTLVITAVFTSQKLRTVTNMFIVSLAVADLSLGLMVLPYSSANEVLRYWPFGSIWCSAWLAIDVWLSTASIFNLCAISLDRYLAITRPFRYPRLMSPTRGKILLASVWVGSFLICFPPLIGWNERKDIGGGGGGGGGSGGTLGPQQLANVSGGVVWAVENAYFVNNVTYYVDGLNSSMAVQEVNCDDEMPVCQLTSSRGYVVYSALGSFFAPVWIMVFFYWRIYLTAARTSGALRRGVLTTRTSGLRASSSDSSVTLRVHRGGGAGSRSPNGDGSSMRLLSVRDAYHRNSYSPRHDRNPHNGVHHGSPGGAPNSQQREIQYTQLHERAYREFVQRKPPKMLIKFKKSPAPPPRNLELYGPNGSGGLEVSTLPVSPASPEGRVEIEENDIMRDEESTSEARGPTRLLSRMGRVQLKNHFKRIHKERKAAKTVGIIVGCFILCWLPFFSVYLLGAFCETCTPSLVFIIFFWLGYCNSAINPCVYALFSKDFRYAFKKLLRCRCERKTHHRRSHGLRSVLTSLRLQISSKASDSNSE